MIMDSAGNSYVDVDNIRLTFVPAIKRQDAKDWSGKDVLRIQAYRDSTAGNSLHKGAELPIEALETWSKLAGCLITLALHSTKQSASPTKELNQPAQNRQEVIRCLNDRTLDGLKDPDLTVGRVYNVIAANVLVMGQEAMYSLVGDNGHQIERPKHIFTLFHVC